jgi:hypothetical protein
MVIACWRRQHGEDFVAQVVERESGEYEAAVWDEPSTPLRRVPRTFRHLESAKAAADDLVRRMFQHRCTLDHCGDWMLWHEARI